MGEHDDEYGQEDETHGSPDIALAEPQREVQPPRMFKVLLINDDYTPMEFVIEVLETFFMMNGDHATQVMLQVHTDGKAVCGVFNRDVAETKVNQVNRYARQSQHPLLCEMDEE